MSQNTNSIWASISEYPQIYSDYRSQSKPEQPEDAIPSFSIGSLQIIPISGMIVPEENVASDLRFYGIPATSYQAIRIGLKKALLKDEISAALMIVNSGGGFISGIDQTIHHLNNLRAEKPVFAYVDNLSASAAYWLSAGAHKIVSSSLAQIGSIGSYAVVVDTSELMTKMGAKVIMIKSGEHKGVGHPGVAITETQIDLQQKLINELSAKFSDQILSWRPGLNSDIFDARVCMPEEAMKNNMIDAISDDMESLIITLIGE